MQLSVNRLKYAIKRLPRTWPEFQYTLQGQGLVVTSIPKAGTHMLSRVMRLLRFRLPFEIGLMQYYGWPENTEGQNALDDIVSAIHRIKPRQYLFSHLIPHPAIVNATQQTKTPVLFIYRDPRALIWSHINHVFRLQASKYHAYYTQTMKTPEACIPLVIEGAAAHDADFPHFWLPDIRSYYDSFMAWTQYEHVLAIRFEDLVGEQGGGDANSQRHSVERTLQHIEYPYTPAILENIIQNLYSAESATFHKGKIDAWRDHFTDDHIRLFNDVSGNLLHELGYAE